ncbi:exo-alpha-sialidase [Candidatus Saccharibacteria bacterium]|nr:exo-alpha-sialidase [Candidatus Saccharibacteria bacterium]
MANKNQNGFHLVAIVLVILVLGVAGIAAWRVFKNSSKNQPSAVEQLALTPDRSGKINQIDIAKLDFDQKAAVADPIGDKNGPFYHDVHTASSPDGVRFSGGATQILNHASVPDAMKLPSGQIVIYAVDGAARSKSGILVAVSSDQGKTWTAGSMQLTSSRVGGVADPQITLTDSGKLRLFYIAFPGPPTPGQPPTSVNRVYSATSSDGINFKEEQGVRFEYGQITDPDVIKIDNRWFMYLAQGPKQIYATSNDGSSFTYQGIARQKGSVSKTVSVGDGKYRQFYCANGISSSTTTDGINWVDESVNLTAAAGKIICDPSPVQLDNNSWLMIYKLASPNQ